MNDGKSTGRVFLIGSGPEDRETNIRRIGFVARLLARNGVAVLGTAISPYQRSRDDVMPSIKPIAISHSTTSRFRSSAAGLR